MVRTNGEKNEFSLEFHDFLCIYIEFSLQVKRVDRGRQFLVILVISGEFQWFQIFLAS